MASFLFLLAPVILGVLLSSCVADNILFTGESLSSGQTLSYGGYSFIMQGDCNLVLYDTSKPIWASSTGGRSRD
ncbi:agglutinin [Canna indica]|uniref:Agglutinin n=1 Tax=Canna indica TaxID=4628 RepID=A0AAQ3Q634_9LILI|nr:agglutinin [Canna indica]